MAKLIDLIPSEARDKLAELAVVMALEAPAKRSQNSVSATVTWDSIAEVRACVTASGIDFAALHKMAREIECERKAER